MRLSGKTQMVITHPGDAHADDVLSVGLALTALGGVGNLNEVRVVRRDPTPEELEDPAVLVLDVGGRHEPALGNFDHHQLPRGVEECAFSLLSKDFGLEGLFERRPWYRRLIWMDSIGPFQTARKLGLPEIPMGFGPIQSSIISLFGEMDEVELWMKELLRRVVFDLIREAQVFEDKVGKTPYEIRVVKDKRVLVTDLLSEESVTDYLQEKEGAHILVTHDNRGEGWTLYRYKDYPGIDFYRLSGEEEHILFTHKGGFIAKTRMRLPIEEVLALVEKAID